MYTSLERWQALFQREIPDRVPTDFWSTSEVLKRLLQDLNCATEDDLWRKLHIDRLHTVAPHYQGPPKRDIWNLEYQTITYADGAGVYQEIASHPLAGMSSLAELEQFDWPNPDWFDYSQLPTEIEALHQQGWPVQCGSFEPFLLYCYLRGMEQSFMDLVLNPEFASAILERIFNFYYTQLLRSFENVGSGKIEVCYIAEDLGTQTGLLMSEELINYFLKPNMKKMIDLVHQFGIKAFHHSDGAVRPLIRGMIHIGIDALNPIQWRCPGMDRRELKAEFGNALVFHGAMDNQYTLPYGSLAEVIAEVKENIDIFGAGGGYILAPCHNIQPITSTEKIVAMYQTTYAYGRY
ncbi:uroporphyrinogen-III decarboxylase-like protein [candidate division KSB1 bacterium]|nr:uroporphyrinogen-III decarboxylase-like protein [candidate division KSB1 bacterium]